jgi:predicted MFS family arabinose efflux permease
MAEYVGWRGVFVISTGMMALALAATVIGFRHAPKGGRFDLGSALTRYGQILSTPRALALFAFVFVEACALFGAFPYIAPLLEERGEGPSLAGAIIGGFAVGGLIYSILVGWMLRHLGIYRILICGGILAGIALVGLGLSGNWQSEAAAMLGMGLGFYMLHNTFQAQVTEVMPSARASTVALHAFSFFCGQAVSVVLMGAGIRTIGLAASTQAAAVVIVLVGLMAAYVLSRPYQPRGR